MLQSRVVPVKAREVTRWSAAATATNAPMRGPSAGRWQCRRIGRRFAEVVSLRPALEIEKACWRPGGLRSSDALPGAEWRPTGRARRTERTPLVTLDRLERADASRPPRIARCPPCTGT